MKLIFTISLIFLTHNIFSQEIIKKISEHDFSIGKTVEVQSTILGENRILNIYLPESYAKEPTKKYPVIYLLDGSKDEDFIHISGLVQFGSFPWINLVPESIIVGISNVDRKRDFTYPSKNELDRKDLPTSGNSELFINFIENELQPFIETTFRTAGSKTLIGQSLGGLLATEILLKKPDLFDQYIIVSPSLWWDNTNLLQFEPKKYTTTKSIYIAVGKEGKIMEQTAKKLYKKLEKTKKDNTKIYFDFLKNKDHGDALHIAVYNAFEKIYKQQKE